MSDKMRWIAGDHNPVEAAVDSATVIEIGDLLWQNIDSAGRGNAKPASALKLQPVITAPPIPLDVAERLLLDVFADRFLGVAMQRSCDGDTSPVRVATTGVFEFTCHLAKYELGDLIGAWPENDDRLGNQIVAKTTNSAYAIARVAKFEHKAATSVLIDIRSTVMGRWLP